MPVHLSFRKFVKHSQIQLFAGSAVIEFNHHSHESVQIAHVPMFTYLSLVVVIVVHYFPILRNSLQSTNQDFHTQMSHDNQLFEDRFHMRIGVHMGN